MPNWCTNRLVVSGADVTEFVARANPELPVAALEPLIAGSLRGSVDRHRNAEELRTQMLGRLGVCIDFQGHRPVPDDGDWYENRTKLWGTKWNAHETDVREITAQRFDAQFETAWAPPLAWLSHVASDHPELRFHLAYSEPGIGFYGLLRLGPHGIERHYIGDMSDEGSGNCDDPDEDSYEGLLRFSQRWFAMR
jgi:hypothetical protein